MPVRETIVLFVSTQILISRVAEFPTEVRTMPLRYWNARLPCARRIFTTRMSVARDTVLISLPLSRAQLALTYIQLALTLRESLPSKVES